VAASSATISKKDGKKYCTRHAHTVDSKKCRRPSVPGRCPFLGANGKACGRRHRTKSKKDGKMYCKRHARKMDDKRPLSSSESHCVRTGGPKHRLRRKTTMANSRLRAQCDWQGGCTSRACAAVPHQPNHRYCRYHAGLVGGNPVFFVCIDDYHDGLFRAHDAGEMSSSCEYCKSLNFEDEKVGRPPHFQLCCRNGKTCRLPKVPKPPTVLEGLLSGSDHRSPGFKEKFALTMPHWPSCPSAPP